MDGDCFMGRPLYYDKQGKPIAAEQMAELKWGPLTDGWAGLTDYARVGWDAVGGAEVSTVWLGIDHGYFRDQENYRPVIFETMVFGDERYDGFCERYHTEEEALVGHQRIVDAVHAGQDLAEQDDLL